MDLIWRVLTTVVSETRVVQLAGILTALIPGAKVHVISIAPDEKNLNLLSE
jgi:hypothetical protein